MNVAVSSSGGVVAGLQLLTQVNEHIYSTTRYRKLILHAHLSHPEFFQCPPLNLISRLLLAPAPPNVFQKHPHGDSNHIVASAVSMTAAYLYLSLSQLTSSLSKSHLHISRKSRQENLHVSSHSLSDSIPTTLSPWSPGRLKSLSAYSPPRLLRIQN